MPHFAALELEGNLQFPDAPVPREEGREALPALDLRPNAQLARGPADDLLAPVAGDREEGLVDLEVAAVREAGDRDAVGALMTAAEKNFPGVRATA